MRLKTNGSGLPVSKVFLQQIRTYSMASEDLSKSVRDIVANQEQHYNHMLFIPSFFNYSYVFFSCGTPPNY
jgi:hypothetical protein